jgi:hypothetical protein
MGLKFSAEMTMTVSGVDTPGENELVAIAAELERYWSEQWRRAKEICDLLEQRLATRTPGRPQLRVVSTGDVPAPLADEAPARPSLRLIDA